jgi:hypothetical protein
VSITPTATGPNREGFSQTSEFSACVPIQSVTLGIAGFSSSCGPVGASVVILGGFGGATVTFGDVSTD